jgi:hypothetical protein
MENYLLFPVGKGSPALRYTIFALPVKSHRKNDFRFDQVY